MKAWRQIKSRAGTLESTGRRNHSTLSRNGQPVEMLSLAAKPTWRCCNSGEVGGPKKYWRQKEIGSQLEKKWAVVVGKGVGQMPLTRHWWREEEPFQMSHVPSPLLPTALPQGRKIAYRIWFQPGQGGYH